MYFLQSVRVAAVSFVFIGMNACSSKEAAAPKEEVAAAVSSPDAPIPGQESQTDKPAVDAGATPTSGTAVSTEAGDQATNGAVSTADLRRVMYVKVKSAVLREQPSETAKPIGKLSKGDHVLVTIDGDWARTEDGRFLAVKGLSDKGIGKRKRQAQWNQSKTTEEGSK